MATESIAVSSHTVDKVNKAKVTLENYYSNLVCQHEERENRYDKRVVTVPKQLYHNDSSAECNI